MSYAALASRLPVDIVYNVLSYVINNDYENEKHNAHMIYLHKIFNNMKLKEIGYYLNDLKDDQYRRKKINQIKNYNYAEIYFKCMYRTDYLWNMCINNHTVNYICIKMYKIPVRCKECIRHYKYYYCEYCDYSKCDNSTILDYTIDQQKINKK